MLVVVSLATTLSCGIMEVTTGIYIFYRRQKAVASTTKTNKGMELSLYMLSLKAFLGGLVTLLVQVTTELSKF